MRSVKAVVLTLSLLVTVIAGLAPVFAATQPSIPINGRYSTLTVKIYIPAYPKWAHDIVLNATLAWNLAQQLWDIKYSDSRHYSFVEASEVKATSIVSFSMPSAYAAFAVGWTTYDYASGSQTLIIGTQTFLTPNIFSVNQEANATARHYASWLALHEMGRVLGLGSVLDGNDIMDPLYTPERITQIPRFSTLDLYALQVLAAGATPSFVTLPADIPNQYTPSSRQSSAQVTTVRLSPQNSPSTNSQGINFTGVTLPQKEVADGFVAIVTGLSITNHTSIEIYATLQNTNPVPVQINSVAGFASVNGYQVADGTITPTTFILNPQQTIPIRGIITTHFDIYQAFGDSTIELKNTTAIPFNYNTTIVHIVIDVNGSVFGIQLHKTITEDATLNQLAKYGG